MLLAINRVELRRGRAISWRARAHDHSILLKTEDDHPILDAAPAYAQ
jgi:hypothetical protein